MSLKVLTVATEETRALEQLKVSATALDYKLVILDKGKQFRGLNQKLHAVGWYLETYKPQGTIVYVDGYDCVFVRSPEELLEDYAVFGHPFIMSAEVNCHPYKQYQGRQSFARGRYPYLNSGCWIGEAQEVRSVFREMRARQLPVAGNDQGFLTDYYYTNPGRILLDEQAVLFQSLWLAEGDIDYTNRVYNRYTHTFPSVLHGNGGASLEAAFRYLGLKS